MMVKDKPPLPKHPLTAWHCGRYTEATPKGRGRRGKGGGGGGEEKGRRGKGEGEGEGKRGMSAYTSPLSPLFLPHIHLPSTLFLPLLSLLSLPPIPSLFFPLISLSSLPHFSPLSSLFPPLLSLPLHFSPPHRRSPHLKFLCDVFP